MNTNSFGRYFLSLLDLKFKAVSNVNKAFWVSSPKNSLRKKIPSLVL